MKLTRTRTRRGASALAAAVGTLLLHTASASELSYTFLDFQFLDSTVDAAGIQAPVPTQTVSVTAGDGEGIAVGGSVAIGQRFYAAGSYRSSIIDTTGQVTSPFLTVDYADDFDLTLGRFSFGYRLPIGEVLDLIAEVSFDSVTYDFGSVAGENFDLEDSGVGGQLGFRWNPTPSAEIFLFGRHSPVGMSDLSALTLEADTNVYAGFRWYVFPELGLGIEYESGEVEMTAISMRFGFGDLPW